MKDSLRPTAAATTECACGCEADRVDRTRQLCRSSRRVVAQRYCISDLRPSSRRRSMSPRVRTRTRCANSFGRRRLTVLQRGGDRQSDDFLPARRNDHSRSERSLRFRIEHSVTIQRTLSVRRPSMNERVLFICERNEHQNRVNRTITHQLP